MRAKSDPGRALRRAAIAYTDALRAFEDDASDERELALAQADEVLRRAAEAFTARGRVTAGLDR
jgi:hypothetical protein